MVNFFISILVFAVSVFLLGVSIRYGLIGAGRLDDYFSAKTQRTFTGFHWYYRLPFGIGFIPEYFFYLVIGYANYFKTNWWPLKTSGFLSVLVALAMLKSRSMVYQYFTFDWVNEGGVMALFTSGTFVWFLNIIVLLYLTLFVLIVIESIKMHGMYAPVRILTYSLLSFMMAQLSIITLGLIAAVSLIYIVFKVIGFLFFSRRRRHNRRNEEEDDESTGDILRGGMRVFKEDVLVWEQEIKNTSASTIKPAKQKVKTKVKIRRKKAPSKKVYESDVPRLHPD